MPIALGKPVCRGVSPSAPAELAWLLNLLAQTARYAEPALAELDASLLPGIGRLRAPTRLRLEELWGDGLAGCPELMYAAHQADCVLDDDPKRLFAWFEATGKRSDADVAMLTEPEHEREAIKDRLRRLHDNARARHVYRDILVDVWRLASGTWERDGRATAAGACVAWQAKLDAGASIEELVPPRHPLTRADQLGF